MDAHVFRALCRALTPRLTGAWLEKIQEPAPGVTSLALSLPRRPSPSGDAGASRKAWLVLRAERKDPFLFLTTDKPAAPLSPSAPIMRLRKYAAGRRVVALVSDFTERRLWLLLGGEPPAELSPRAGEGAAALWLLLDLREGPALRLLGEDACPRPATPRWPDAPEIEDACREWRDWPVVTPALRRALPLMDVPDQAALLEDLRLGDGDLFLYLPADASGAPCKAAPDAPACLLSAWPLPPERRPALWPGWREIASDDAPALAERAGKLLVLARVGRETAALAAAPLLRQERRTARLLEKLREEERRLREMCERQADAETLRANLWRWPADARLPFVEAEEYGDDGAPRLRRIAIDPRRSVREEMEALFHAARRGKRGLEHVARRRRELEAEMARLERERRGVLAGGAPQSASRTADDLAGQERRLPRNVQLFISSDGFALLRGRDARGNGAARRMAAPHDIWLHADGGPGSHVIIRRAYAGQEVPERTLDEAGGLAACKSWLRDAARARILYAEVRHIKPLRGAAPGTVRMDKIWLSREVPVRPELETLLAPAEAAPE